MLPTIRAILRTFPRTAAAFFLSFSLLIAYQAWDAHLQKRADLANARLDKAGLLRKKPAPPIYIPDNQNAAFYYRQADLLASEYSEGPSTQLYIATLTTPLSQPELDALNFIRQARGLSQSINSKTSYSPEILINLCIEAALHSLNSENHAPIAEYLNDIRWILHLQNEFDPKSPCIANYLAALNYISTTLKEDDPLKPVFVSIIHELEDKTLINNYRKTLLSYEFGRNNSIYKQSEFKPLAAIKYSHEAEDCINLIDPTPNHRTNYILLDEINQYIFSQGWFRRVINLNTVQTSFPKIQLTQAALAFQLYHLDHGEFPKNARALIPEYLPESFSYCDYELQMKTYPDGSPRPVIFDNYHHYDTIEMPGSNTPVKHTEFSADLAYRPIPPKLITPTPNSKP